MARIEAAIKEAIARGARRHIRQVVAPLRRETRRLRGLVRQLRADVAALRARSETQAARPQVSEAEARAARLSPRLIRTLRARLALTQAQVARLVGVSGAAVVQWERGRSSPAGANRAKLVALRRIGRREARRLLAGLAESKQGRVRRSRRRVRRARRGGRR
jgi:DNA-binding transcriptional regulator YiaG